MFVLLKFKNNSICIIKIQSYSFDANTIGYIYGSQIIIQSAIVTNQ